MRVRHGAGGTQLWLSADDTYRWAHRPGAHWPGSDLSGHRVYVELDRNGDLLDVTVDGKYGDPQTGMHGRVDVSANELDALIEDAIGNAHLRGDESVRRGSWRGRTAQPRTQPSGDHMAADWSGSRCSCGWRATPGGPRWGEHWRAVMSVPPQLGPPSYRGGPGRSRTRPRTLFGRTGDRAARRRGVR